MFRWLAVTVLLVLFSAQVDARETHIFFGKREGELHKDWVKEKRLPVQLGEGLHVAGDFYGKTEVSTSGDEVKTSKQRGVWLSRGKGFQVGGGTGMITIKYPYGIGVVEVVYEDTSAIPPSNGSNLTVETRSNVLSLKTLNAEAGGDAGKRSRLVHQFFQPVSSGNKSGLTSTIRLKAWGYDELRVVRISLYTNYKLAVNTNFLDGAEGKKSDIKPTGEDTERAMFRKWVVLPVQKHYEKRQSKDTPRSVSNPSDSVGDLNGKDISQLIVVLNALRGESPPLAAEPGIRRDVEAHMKKRGGTPLRYLGMICRGKTYKGMRGVAVVYTYKRDQGPEKVVSYSTFLKNGRWTPGSQHTRDSVESMRQYLLRTIKKEKSEGGK